MPRNFRFPTASADLYLPYAALTDAMVPWRRDVHTLNVVARGRPGTTVSEIRAEMRTIALRNSRGYPEDKGWDDATVISLQAIMTEGVRPSLLVLGGRGGICPADGMCQPCFASAGDGARRERELAIRIALGASRWRIMRQVLTESLLIAIAGGAASLGVAAIAIRLLTSAGIGNTAMHPDVYFDRTSVLAALGLSLLTSLIFGALPAIRSAHTDPQEAMRSGGRGNDQRRGAAVARRTGGRRNRGGLCACGERGG